MTILGALIRTNIIEGITELYPCLQERNFHYCFSIITKSGPVEFKSPEVTDVHLATKQEQEDLRIFKEQYSEIRMQVGVLIGDVQSIMEERLKQMTEEARVSKIATDYKLFCDATDKLSAALQKSKSKSLGQWLQQLGNVWLLGKEIKESSI